VVDGERFGPECYRFTSLMFLLLDLGRPQSGANLTLACTFALPVLFSLFSALPLAFTNSLSLPASSARLRWLFTLPVFLSLSLPENGTLTFSFADPRFLFTFAPRSLSLLETGFPTAARQAAASTEPMSVASDPRAVRTPGRRIVRGPPRWSWVRPFAIPASSAGLSP
jgi:hypothetical protein